MATDFDPITLEVLWSRLVNITEECWVTLWRTAFSMIIGEARDFGCELLDGRGKSLAHSPRSMPVFNLTLPRAVDALLQRFPSDTLQPGDLLATNDPWICAGHLHDVALVTPVFRKDRLVGLVGSIAHCSDVGGSLDPLGVREVYEEGLQIHPMKLHRAGIPNQEVYELIAANVRKGDMVIGDLRAQISANNVGADCLHRFMDEYGLDDLSDLANVIQNRTLSRPGDLWGACAGAAHPGAGLHGDADGSRRLRSRSRRPALQRPPLPGWRPGGGRGLRREVSAALSDLYRQHLGGDVRDPHSDAGGVQGADPRLGAGRRRGGLGQRVRLRKLYDDGQPAFVSLHPQGIEVDTPGHFGGRAGRRAAIRLEEEGRVRDHAELGGLAELRRPSQVLTIELAGGSGYGPPEERPVDEIERDLEQGYITRAALSGR